jgi:hypothetical protein
MGGWNTGRWKGAWKGHPSGEARKQWVRAPSFLAAGASQTARLRWGLLQQRERSISGAAWAGRSLAHQASPGLLAVFSKNRRTRYCRPQPSNRPCPPRRNAGPVHPPHSAGRLPILISFPAHTLHDTPNLQPMSLRASFSQNRCRELIRTMRWRDGFTLGQAVYTQEVEDELGSSVNTTTADGLGHHCRRPPWQRNRPGRRSKNGEYCVQVELWMARTRRAKLGDVSCHSQSPA